MVADVWYNTAKLLVGLKLNPWCPGQHLSLNQRNLNDKDYCHIYFFWYFVGHELAAIFPVTIVQNV